MSEAPASDDLEARVRALENALGDLRREVGPRRTRRGFPRPPRPSELLEFTESYAIPAAVAALEAQVAALRALQRALQDVERDREDDSRRRERTRVESLGRETAAALDRTLDDLRDAIESGGLPDSPVARDLLSEARRLNDEIRTELERGDAGESRRRERRDRHAEEVETEIEVIRKELEDEQ